MLHLNTELSKFLNLAFHSLLIPPADKCKGHCHSAKEHALALKLVVENYRRAS